MRNERVMQSAPGEAAVEFRDVQFNRDGRRVIADFSLAIQSGETMALLGRSGSGKTTLLKLINALLLPSGGDVLVENRATSAWDPIRLRRHIGYVIQETGLFPHYEVERNVALVPGLERWSKKRIAERVDEVLALVGLEPDEFRRRYPHQLSGGQRQRVGVARALAGDPPLLLMDEPFGALDPLTRGEIQHEFLELTRRVRKTIVLVTHDLREALLLSTRTALVEQGRLAGVYSRREFLNSPDPAARRYIEAFEAGDEVLRKGMHDEPD
ncbi:MAG: ATP-binding cassette domain-containing protein [Terriglobia bacterium]